MVGWEVWNHMQQARFTNILEQHEYGIYNICFCLFVYLFRVEWDNHAVCVDRWHASIHSNIQINTKFLDVEAKLIERQYWADLTSTHASRRTIQQPHQFWLEEMPNS